MSATRFRPYRPLAIRLLNGIGRVLAGFGLKVSLEPEALMRRACQRAGAADFTDKNFEPALKTLCQSIDQEANLHPFGRWIMRRRLLDILVTRLRVEALLADHPEIQDIDISPPLVIAGLQRTGTTMLHRLLAADPDTRALRSWEAISPLPHPEQRPEQPDRRIDQARTAEKGLAYLAPEFFSIHPVEAEAPEEDVLLLEYSLMSQVPPATLNVPSYNEWLARQDMTPAYRYLKTLLQVLHWQQGARRWVLKTPAHLEHLDVLLAVFPSAKIIQTHRDPLRTTASFSSMLAHGYGVFSDTVDAAGVARRWLDINVAMVERALSVRRDHPEAFVDVSYYALMRDPIAEVERIYEAAGLVLSPVARQAMEESREHNRQNRHGRHHYSLEQFGLSPQLVDARYARYREAFAIPYENPA